MLLDAEGMRFKLARTAVNRMTSNAAPSCLPNLVLPAYTARMTIEHKMTKTYIGLLIKLMDYGLHLPVEDIK